jgi:hypothetical protein
MLLAVLAARNHPHSAFKVDVAAPHAQNVAGPSRAEDRELESPGGDSFPAPKLRHEIGHGLVVKRSKVLDLAQLALAHQNVLEMALPPRWVRPRRIDGAG